MKEEEEHACMHACGLPTYLVCTVYRRYFTLPYSLIRVSKTLTYLAYSLG